MASSLASSNDFHGLALKEVTKLDRKELGRGSYGRVYAVNYHGTICAAKEIHSILIEEVGEVEMRRTVESFMRECYQCSALRHPNVIQFLGVYYPSVAGASGVQGRTRLPVMVMEMMVDSLTSLVDKHEKIPVPLKFSIVHDVSLGLCYLHNHDPPIVHRDLSPNNILLTAHHVAKISDLGVAKVIKADSKRTMTKAPGTVDFMPPESLSRSPVYGPPMDVFSFAGIVLHTFNQQWPSPSDQVDFDPKTRKMVALSEAERRQQYLVKLRGEIEVLRPLVEKCLDNDPAARPTIAVVCERIQVNKDVYMKESPQDVITLHQQVEQKNGEINQLRSEVDRLRSEVDQLKSENDKLKNQPSSTTHAPQKEASQLSRVALGEEGSTMKTSKLKIDIIITCGCSGALDSCFTVLEEPSQNILVPVPVYPLDSCVAASRGLTIKYYQLLPDRQWEADVNQMDQLIDKDTVAIVIVNSSNPCGSVYSKQHLLDILAVAEKHSLPIIADEIYNDLVFKGQHSYPIATLSKNVPILSCGGIGKKYLVPGWRVGWILIHDRHDRFKKEVVPSLINVSRKSLGITTLVQAVLPMILDTVPKSYYENTMSLVEANANIAYGELSVVGGLTPVIPSGALYMMVGVKLSKFPHINTTVEFMEKVMSEESVFILCGECFLCPGFIRLVLLMPSERMKEACSRIREFSYRHYKV
ncbi:tyrosine aminotransferase-like isoform X2 [Dysidea avara]|uniref:tyrosine aminotransferase-like isoform X2 n=1 Tax=Dysidea avara TaxID=196820 RepID=UPI0033295CFB